jgi:hypothetical protein
MIHCHNLSHEDHDMMFQYMVGHHDIDCDSIRSAPPKPLPAPEYTPALPADVQPTPPAPAPAPAAPETTEPAPAPDASTTPPVTDTATPPVTDTTTPPVTDTTTATAGGTP